MAVVLGVVAGTILFLYSFYFIRILQGSPRDLETEIVKAFAAWVIARGPAARGTLWVMVLISLVFEVAYFLLVFYVIRNPFMLTLTGFFAGVELVHLMLVAAAFYRFFQGKLMLKHLFNWPMERTSAVLFFTHSLLVLFSLIWG